MRLGKGFVAFLLLTVMVSGTAFAQGVSTSDSIYMTPLEHTITTPVTSDTQFTFEIYANWDSTLGAIAIPLRYPQSGFNLLVDSTVTDAGNMGVTYGPLAGSPVPWTLLTSLINNAAYEFLLGFVSFGQADPAANGLLVTTHWVVPAGASDELIIVDSGLVGTSRLTMTTTGALDYIPQWGGAYSVDIGGTSVGDNGTLPLEYGLDQNFPNPFNAQTMISFAMPVPAHVTLRVYNVLGQEVVTLLDQKMDAAQHEILWEGNNNQGGIVASGTYFYSLKIGEEFEETRQMTLLK